MNGVKNSTRSLTLLSQLLLGAAEDNRSGRTENQAPSHGGREEIARAIASYDRPDFGELWGLASSNHVVLRAFPGLHEVMVAEGNDKAEWVQHAIAKEQVRIQTALSFLFPICQALESAGDVIVIKSLDHWPDLGSDLDLYTNAESTDIVAIMRDRFKAQLAERSWGDRLANKWNFVVPGLPELVEVHVSRLGQTGEQVAITRSLVTRSRMADDDSLSSPARSSL